jgi:hypothetical protein
MPRRIPSVSPASTEAWHGGTRIWDQPCSVAVGGIRYRSLDHDPDHHIPGVADGGEEKRDLRSREQIEARCRLPEEDERREQEQQIAQYRD